MPADRLRPRKKPHLVAAFGLIALTVAAIVTLAYLQMQRHLDALAWMHHTTEVRRLLAEELAAVQSVETGARGFALTGDGLLLDPYETGRGHARRVLDDLGRLVVDNPAQEQQLYALTAAVNRRISAASLIVEAVRAGDRPSALRVTAGGEGAAAMSEVRSRLSAMDDAEQHLMAQRRAQAANSRRLAGGALILASLLFPVPLVFWMLGRRRHDRAVAEATTLLRGSEEKFRLLADHATDLVLLQDKDARARYVSPSSQRLLGYAPEELLGAKSTLDFVHPDDLKIIASHTGAIMDSRDPSAAVRFRMRTRRGAYRWFESRTFIVEDRETREVLFQTTARDVTDQVTAEQALARSNEVYRTLVKNLPKTAVIIYDRGLRCRLADGPDLRGMLALEKRQVEGLPVIDVLSPDNRAMTLALYEGALAGRSSELESMHGENALNVMLLPLAVEGVEAMGLAVVRDVTEERRLEDLMARQAEELRSLSLRDELTGLNNRRGFVTLAAQQLKLAVRSRRPLAVVFVDLNGMKPINDSLGHQAGDDALKDAGKVLRATFRESDILGRLGGDEFAVLVNDIQPDDIRFVLARLDAAVERHNQTAQRPYRLSISIGVVHHDPATLTSVEDLLAEADRRMYEDKRSRKLERRLSA